MARNSTGKSFLVKLNLFFIVTLVKSISCSLIEWVVFSDRDSHLNPSCCIFRERCIFFVKVHPKKKQWLAVLIKIKLLKKIVTSIVKFLSRDPIPRAILSMCSEMYPAKC